MTPVRIIAALKTYAPAVHALRGVTLGIESGELIAICGPSGCGKSTLLSLVGCVDLPTSGEVAIEGSVTSRLSDRALTRLRRDRIGTVFQAFNLLQTLTIAENVAVPLVLQGRGLAEIEQRVSAVLARVGIAEKADVLPAHLSGGQAQRAAIARAIVHAPAIVLADEPTGNLDSQTGAEILCLLRELATSGQAIAIATHDATAAANCDRAVYMRDGTIVA